ncbi:MAG: hypothetical protein NUV52_02650, partial [Candidatus Roizmanbacteria bacterium]|nr:hypothetical protein [Candidatus Roizmanbacteria bacterium]
MPELSKEVRHEIRTGLGIKHDSVRAKALEEMRKEVYTPRGARSVLEELANVKKQEVTEKVIHASLKNAFREVRSGAVVDGDVTRFANTEAEARRWHELHLRGIEGMPASDVGALARRMVEATNDMFKDPRLFASIPEAERVKAFGTIMNSEAYRTAVKTRLDAALLEAQRYDPSQLDAVVTAAETDLTTKEAAYKASPSDASRTAWEESLLALDAAKERRAKPYGGIEEVIQNIGKDALIEVLPTKITAAVDSYHTKEDAQKTETSTKAHDAMSRLSEAWKKRRINRSTFEEEMVVDKRKGNKLKRRMMRKGSEGVMEEILSSKKVNAETREAFAQLKKDKPEEYAMLKAQATSSALREYLNAGGRLSRRELKKIVKQGHEADLYQVVAMAMRGKNSPADVAANDLKIDDTVRKYLKETPIDRIKPAA